MNYIKFIVVIGILFLFVAGFLWVVNIPDKISLDKVDFVFAREKHKADGGIELTEIKSLSKSETNYFVFFPVFKFESQPFDFLRYRELFVDSLSEINLSIVNGSGQSISLNKYIAKPNVDNVFYFSDFYNLSSKDSSFREFIDRYNKIMSGKEEFHISEIGNGGVCYSLYLPSEITVDSVYSLSLAIKFTSKRTLFIKKEYLIKP